MTIDKLIVLTNSLLIKNHFDMHACSGEVRHVHIHFELFKNAVLQFLDIRFVSVIK